MTPPASLFPGGQHLGLRELRQPSNPEVDILFIHGLRGHAYNTWVSGDVYWPLDFLASDFPTARILTFGYDADVASLFGNAGQGTLRDHAETLVGEFAVRRGRSKRPVIIITHSLGGLVAKKALCVSAEAVEESAERALDRCLLGICFLGTPHRGSDPAKLGSIVAAIASLSISVNRRIVDVLKTHSEVLADLTSSFGNWMRKNSHRLNMVCFYEERECTPWGLIVPKAFATIDGYPQMQIPADHQQMCKFSSRYEAGYVRIQDHLRSWLEIDLDSDNDDYQALEKMKSDLNMPLTTEAKILMDSLFFPRLYRREDSIAAPHKDTFTWIETNPMYQEWYKSFKNILWIKGHPGTGKSIMMKKILEMAKSDKAPKKSTIILSHFFAKDGAPLQQSIEGLYRSLLVQLLHHPLKGIADTIKKLLKRRGLSLEDSCWDVEDLAYFFTHVISDTLSEFNVRIYIDDVHECRGDVEVVRRLVNSFYELVNKSHAKAHAVSTIFSSRHYPILAPRSAEKCICMEDENEKDIGLVVRAELAYKGLNVSFKLWHEIQELAGSSFRWLMLTIEVVKESKMLGWPDEQIISRANNNVPAEIERAYESALHSLPTSEYANALRLFQLMTSSTLKDYRPPGLGVVRPLLNVDERLTILESIAANAERHRISDDSQMQRMLPALSCGLLEVDGDGENAGIQCIHHSVIQFMLKSGLGFLGETQSQDEEITQRGNQRMYHLIALSAAIEMGKLESNFAEAAAKYAEDICFQATQYYVDDKINSMLMKNMDSVKSIVAIGDDDLVSEFIRIKLKEAEEPGSSSERPGNEDPDWTDVGPRTAQLNGKALACLVDIWPSLQLGETLTSMLALWTGFVAKSLDDSDDVHQGLLSQIEEFRRVAQFGFTIFWHRMLFMMTCKYPSVTLALALLHDGVMPRDSAHFRASLSWALNMAVSESNLPVTKLLLEQPEVEIEGNVYGSTPLLTCLRESDENVSGSTASIVTLLLEKGANLLAKDDNGFTALSMAVAHPATWQAEELLGNGVTIRVLEYVWASRGSPRYLQFQTELEPLLDRALVLAVDQEPGPVCQKVVESLLKHGADPKASNEDGDSALHLAVAKGNVAVVNILLRSGAALDAPNSTGKTPLHIGVELGHEVICTLLLFRGADANKQDNDGGTPLRKVDCYSKNNASVAASLIRYGALIEGSFGDGPDWKTSLIGAAIRGEKLDLLKILLDQGGQTMFERRYGLSILGAAVESHGWKCIEMFSSRSDISFNFRDKYQKTVLMLCTDEVWLTDDDLALSVWKGLLTRSDIEINATSQWDKTAFSCCIGSERSASTICAMLLCLIEMPEFDINAGLQQPRPLSILAKGSFDKSIIPDVLSATLRRADLEVNYRESGLFCPLQIAAAAGNVDAVKLLLADPRTDVNLSFRDEKRVVPPPIQEAAKLGHLEIVQLFLDSPRLEIKAMELFSGPLEDAVTATRSAFSIASEFDQSYVEIVRALCKRKDVDVNRISIAASPLNIGMSAIKRREYEKNDLLEKKEFTQKRDLIRRMEKYLPGQKGTSWKDYLFGEDWHDSYTMQEYLDGQIDEHDKRHYDEEKNTLQHRIKTLEDEIAHRKVIAQILRDNGARSFDSLTERSDADWDKVDKMSVAYLSGIRFLWGSFKQAT